MSKPNEVPKKEGCWMGSWDGQDPKPYEVYENNYRKQICADVATALETEEMPITDRRWTWHFPIPTPAEHEATQEALRCADELQRKAMGYLCDDNSIRVIDVEKADRDYTAARAKLAAVKEAT